MPQPDSELGQPAAVAGAAARSPRNDRRGQLPLVAVAAGVLVVAGLVGAGWVRSRPNGGTAADAPTGPTTEAGSANDPVPAATSLPGCSPPVGELIGDFDGDGCPDGASPGIGGLLTVGSRRFQVGEPGDQVVIGDWNCDGLGTPALLRPATGEVFVFSTWGSRDQPVEISRTAQFVGAIRLVPDAPTPRPDPDDARPSCRQLRVELFGGNRVEVNP